jgi:hypothetical protein
MAKKVGVALSFVNSPLVWVDQETSHNELRKFRPKDNRRRKYRSLKFRPSSAGSWYMTIQVGCDLAVWIS